MGGRRGHGPLSVRIRNKNKGPNGPPDCPYWPECRHSLGSFRLCPFPIRSASLRARADKSRWISPASVNGDCPQAGRVLPCTLRTRTARGPSVRPADIQFDFRISPPVPPPNYAGNVQFPGPLNHPAPRPAEGRAGSDPGADDGRALPSCQPTSSLISVFLPVPPPNYAGNVQFRGH